MPPRVRSVTALALSMATVACGRPGATEPVPVTQLVVGTLATDASTAVQAPDSVFAGSAFAVIVVTEGSLCDTAAGGESRVAGLEATVTPYVAAYRGVCELPLQLHSRSVRVRFDIAGTGTVRVLGAGGRAVTRTVVVRPAP
jgi:hypothetical protein